MSAATYTTRAGDTWDVISLRAVGAERHATELMAANPAHAWTIRFAAGVDLAVPTISTAAASTLPPWKR